MSACRDLEVFLVDPLLFDGHWSIAIVHDRSPEVEGFWLEPSLLLDILSDPVGLTL